MARTPSEKTYRWSKGPGVKTREFARRDGTYKSDDAKPATRTSTQSAGGGSGGRGGSRKIKPAGKRIGGSKAKTARGRMGAKPVTGSGAGTSSAARQAQRNATPAKPKPKPKPKPKGRKLTTGPNRPNSSPIGTKPKPKPKGRGLTTGRNRPNSSPRTPEERIAERANSLQLRVRAGKKGATAATKQATATETSIRKRRANRELVRRARSGS